MVKVQKNTFIDYTNIFVLGTVTLIITNDRLEPVRKTCETVMGTDYIHAYKHYMNDFYTQLQIRRWYNTFKTDKFNVVGISASGNYYNI
jgi:hypothetical protein